MPDETEESEDTSSLTPEIIKSRLKDRGIKTRVRKLSRLLDIYNIANQDSQTNSHITALYTCIVNTLLLNITAVSQCFLKGYFN